MITKMLNDVGSAGSLHGIQMSFFWIFDNLSVL